MVDPAPQTPRWSKRRDEPEHRLCSRTRSVVGHGREELSASTGRGVAGGRWGAPAHAPGVGDREAGPRAGGDGEADGQQQRQRQVSRGFGFSAAVTDPRRNACSIHSRHTSTSSPSPRSRSPRPPPAGSAPIAAGCRSASPPSRSCASASSC